MNTITKFLKKAIKAISLFLINLLGGIIALMLILAVAFGHMPILMHYDFFPDNPIGFSVIGTAVTMVYWMCLGVVGFLIKFAYTQTREQMNESKQSA